VDARIEIGMLLFPGLTQLDLTGPYEVLARVPGARVHLVWKSLEPVRADSGLTMLPSATLADCPRLDIVAVPGGPGTDALLTDREVLGWLIAQANTARYVVSICTGSLLLGAAGLITGKRASCHWASRHMLAHFGATPSDERVVKDGNVITGGGVTSGIDVALALAAELCGQAVAESIQLGIEYDPHPPFDAGSPAVASAELVAQVRERMARRLGEREEQVRRAAQNLPVATVVIGETRS
jgi:cyclohexyl-isocyanide hydratase